MSDSGLFWPFGNFYDLRLDEQFLLDWCVSVFRVVPFCFVFAFFSSSLCVLDLVVLCSCNLFPKIPRNLHFCFCVTKAQTY